MLVGAAPWLMWALLSAALVAPTAILAKIGVESVAPTSGPSSAPSSVDKLSVVLVAILGTTLLASILPRAARSASPLSVPARCAWRSDEPRGSSGPKSHQPASTATKVGGMGRTILESEARLIVAFAVVAAALLTAARLGSEIVRTEPPTSTNS